MEKSEKVIGNIIKDIRNGIVEREINKMPESVFKEFFLPYFNGEEEITNDNHIIAKWVEFSGGVYNPVDIVDNSGEIITRIPQLIKNSDTNRDKSNSIDYSTIVSEFNLRSKRSSVAGDAYLDKTLNVVGKTIIEDESGSKSDWAKALKVFKTQSVNKRKSSVTKNDDDLSDMLEYD